MWRMSNSVADGELSMSEFMTVLSCVATAKKLDVVS